MKERDTGMNLNIKSFISALAVVLALMIVTYCLTFAIPGGQYERAADGAIVSEESFAPVEGGISFVKWILSPVLVLGSDDNVTIIAILLFLLVIGGVFSAANNCGMMRYMLNSLTAKYGKNRYKLMAVIILFFMAMGSLIGSFEECVPLVPIVVALAINLGWDALTGFAMSLMATGCGFSVGVFNPFTVGVAQKLAGLPMFSGSWFRIITFAFIYGLVLLFTYLHAKKVEKPIAAPEIAAFEKNPKLARGTTIFAVILGIGIALVLTSGLIKALQGYTMIIVAIMFLIAGIASTLAIGMKGKELGRTFLDGVVGMLPAILLILMASSIKFTLVEANILDTILHKAVGLAQHMPRWTVILFVYLVCLVMNFFVPSGSAEAVMLMPLIIPLAAVFNIPAQLCVVAFCFGDGFSNLFYPTNPVLLISLGLADISYGKWIKWSWKFQVANLMLTCGLLLFGLWIGYC